MSSHLGSRLRPVVQRLGQALASLAVVSCTAAPAGAWNGRHTRAAVPESRHSAPHFAASAAAPVAIGAKLVQSAGRARLTFDLSAPVAANAFVLANPARVIVDLSEVNFQVDPTIGKTAGTDRRLPIGAYRFGLFAPGRSRIVIDLNGPAKIVRADDRKIGAGPTSRLSIELAATDAAAFREAAALAARIEAASEARSKPPGPVAADAAARRIILLDPGHGGIDPGASGVNGAVEKDIVLGYAKVLAAKLEASGRYKVVMTRTGDMFVSLGDRLKLAREVHAALLVSIHCDTIAANPQVAGTTVYTVSDRASDAEAARIAEKENRADLAGGLDAKSEDATDVADILFDFTRRETRTYAHVFARTLVEYLKDVTKLNYNPQRSAGFWVLKAPDVPSVLIELGYLSSNADIAMLTSAGWRDKTSAAIMAAIDRVFVADPSAHPAAGPGAAAPAAGSKSDAHGNHSAATVSGLSHAAGNPGAVATASGSAVADAPH